MISFLAVLNYIYLNIIKMTLVDGIGSDMIEKLNELG